MKGLRKCLTPFAPDQSGAAAVFYDMGGIIVICDAGGCAGNICGFDIPYWNEKRSAVFSAGLRDMDAIMGRDKLLAKKIALAAGSIEADFAAVIGTPVPSVIGTDYAALKKMIEKETSLPVICVDTNGMELYDKGEEKAYFELYERFAREIFPEDEGRVNYIGEAATRGGYLQDDGGSYIKSPSFDDIKTASSAKKNIVISPSGFKTARLLRERFGTPYEAVYPKAGEMAYGIDCAEKNILIIHQQVFAHTLRKALYERGAKSVKAASWFMTDEEIFIDGDVRLKEEDDLTALTENGGFDIIIGDEAMKPLAEGFDGIWEDAPHFALSGRIQA